MKFFLFSILLLIALILLPYLYYSIKLENPSNIIKPSYGKFAELKNGNIFYQTFILDFYLVFTSALLFFFNLVYLMPKINKLKDERNEKAFKISHFISVVINFAQLIMLGIVLA